MPVTRTYCQREGWSTSQLYQDEARQCGSCPDGVRGSRANFHRVDAHQTASAAGGLDDRYPDTRLLVDAIRAQIPPELHYLVDDGFNRIVLYDNTAVSATSEKTPNGKYKVTLKVQARKVQADGNGAETPLPLADYIEIGVFSGRKDEEKPLYLIEGKTHRRTQNLRDHRGPCTHFGGH